MTGQPSGRSSSAGYQCSCVPSKKYPVCNDASPSQEPSGVRSRPHSQPAPSACATGRGGITRDAPGRASADEISRSRSSEGVGVHTVATVEGCAHQPAHPHGTREAYVTHRCRCILCRAANTAYQRDRQQAAAEGRTPGGWVDAGPIRAHVERLRAAGLGRRQIAALAGIDHQVVHVLTNGRGGRPPTARCAPGTAERLLAVPLPTVDQLAPGTAVDGIGVRRRLQALVAVGWPQAALAARLGWSRENLGRIVHGYGAGKVTVATRQLIVALCDELKDVPPPTAGSERSRRLAAQRGWVGPSAWGSSTIDDPLTRPRTAVSRPRPLQLLNVRPTADQLTAHPGHLGIQAYFAGARHAAGERPDQFPRPLTEDEVECWMDGWSEHRADHLEVRSNAPAASARPSLPGILATDLDSWYDYPTGRAGDPAQEAS